MKQVHALASLGSGSRGNGTLVRIGGSLFLIDCGFSLKQAERRLARLDLGGGDLSAILVTHEHSDHGSGVAALSHKYRIPVFASFGTLKGINQGFPATAFNSHQNFTVGDVEITPVPVPHDAREPTQFVFQHKGLRVGVLSDLGCVTPHVIQAYKACDGLFLEANHDPNLLANGRYPYRVQQRIKGDLGHLSNEQSAYLLSKVAKPGGRVVIGHVSAQNNHPEIMESCFAPHINQLHSFCYADQSDGVGWITLAEDSQEEQASRRMQ